MTVLKQISALLLCSPFVIVSGPTTADSLIESRALFSGANIYSPTVLTDGATHKMWYSAWQVAGNFNDRIYYRTSTDRNTWSAYQEVLSPAMLGSNVTHVTDPSVTKHWNALSGQYQYTMFYTVCMKFPPQQTCDPQAGNQVWSSVSSNGIQWSGHKVLLSSGLGSAEPSAIIDQQADGSFWKVYYEDRLHAGVIKVAKVDGNRNAISTAIVYTSNETMANPEVQYFNGQWHLFFNVYTGSFNGYPLRGDIKKAIGATNTSFYNAQTLIANSGAPFCATIGPGITPVSGNTYDLYFGLNPTQPNGTCDFTKNTAIHRWRMAE